ncbi:holo-ACP synthase [Haloarcula amylovorans]|uniref:holo-ACP synthase n=1 Tax=Haloarcula amylovorans TaxID=2562280 RepID=UPI0010766D01|nr:holo-ACP synthase [Halomicroarcula amylolytica]
MTDDNPLEPDFENPITVCHGVDIIAIDRIGDLRAEFGESFRDRVFTDTEQTYCEQQADPPQHYAARWAAKEAFLKTLTTPSPTVPTHAIEVCRRDTGPQLLLAPVAQAALESTLTAQGVDPDSADIAVSLSHDQSAGYALGSVTVVGVRGQ